MRLVYLVYLVCAPRWVLTEALRAARAALPHTAHLEVEIDRLDAIMLAQNMEAQSVEGES